MTPNRLLAWLKPTRPASTRSTELVHILERKGVSAAAVSRADERRLALNTRVLSALVEQGVLEEQLGSEVLSRHVGLPAVALRHSIVDLAAGALPEALMRERALLPVAHDSAGALVLACADPPPAAELQELTLALGKEVRPHVALHYFLKRTIQAACEVRRECLDAAYLLGDQAEAPAAGQLPAGKPLIIVPALPVPPCSLVTASAPGRPKAVVALVDADLRSAVLQWLADIGFDTTAVADGPSAARAIAAVGPSLIVMDMQLPALSGLDLLARLSSGERYRHTSKLLLVPRELAPSPAGLANIAGLEIVANPDAEDGIKRLASSVAQSAVPEDRAAQRRAQAAYFRGLALREEGDDAGALRELARALEADPLHAEAYRALAQLSMLGDSEVAGLRAFAMAAHLGAARAEDLIALATLLQRRGELKAAAVHWEQAAKLVAEPNSADRLLRHADALRNGTSGLPGPEDQAPN